MKECYVDRNFSSSSMMVIVRANAILAEYAAQGYDLSLRQLYYQFVSRDYLPNSQASYNRLGSIISDARLAGYVDWDAIKDRGRVNVANAHWDSPAQIVETAARQFKIEKWADQPAYVEVMVEKQALEGILIPACRSVDVAFTANKGYSSSSAMYEAGKRMREAILQGKEVHVLYLGDHDPSGIDMSRDVDERLTMFACDASAYERAVAEWDANPSMETVYEMDYSEEWSEAQKRGLYFEDVSLQVHRLALNWDQVLQYRPPENPAKMTDSRASAYVARYGNSSWELDALEPTLLASLVTDFVENLRDDEKWDAAVAKEEAMRADLLTFADSYGKETK